MKADEITTAWLSSVLGGDVESVSYSRIGDGHVGTSLRLVLESPDPTVPASVVAKLPAEDERSLTLAASVRSYECEVKFYRELAGTVDIRVPECHHAEWEATTNDFVLLLEDMAPARQGDQIAGCTIDQAMTAVTALAGLHGPRWNDPTLAEIDWLSGNDTEGSADAFAMILPMLLPAFAETYAGYLTAEMLELAETFVGEVARFIRGRTGPRCLTHVDYRLDNMLFGTPTGGPPITVVDWQSPAHGSPATDLSYFCGAGLLPGERRVHERALVDAYVEALAAYSIDVDDQWLWEHYRREAFHGLVITMFTSTTVTMNERSQDMFGAMASRHLQHALDLDSLSLI